MNWLEKLVFTIVVWIEGAIMTSFMLPMIPEHLVVPFIVFKVLLYVVAPIVLMIGDSREKKKGLLEPNK